MKKRTYLAILAVCTMLAAMGCGTEKKDADTSAQAKTEAPEEETEKTEAKADDAVTRLVSVDNVEKYITIGEYKGLTLDKTVPEITENDVDAQIEEDLKTNAVEVTDKKDAVQNGDMVTINYVGTKDGVAFDGGTANNYDLTVGDGKMIPGFEEGIVGMKTGETKDVNLTFPEDYLAEDLAGQDVVFKITLQSFRRAGEFNDAWVAENSDYKTTAEYRENTRKTMEENARKYAELSLLSSAWTTVVSNSEVKEYPQEDIDTVVEEFKGMMEKYAKQADMTLEDFVTAQGMTMDAFNEQCEQYAQYKVKQNLIVQGILDAEGLTLEDPECLEIQTQLIQDYGAKDLADLIDKYGQMEVDAAIGLVRVENLIVENADVQEKVSNGDTVGVSGDSGDFSQGIDDAAIDEEAEEDAETADAEETVEIEETADESEESADADVTVVSQDEPAE